MAEKKEDRKGKAGASDDGQPVLSSCTISPFRTSC